MKTNLNAFILKFTEPLHISDAKAEYTSSERFIHSDTIYAAIMQVMASVGEKPDISDFAISSLYPCFIDIEKNESEFFFPALKYPRILDEKKDNIKELKKIKYLSKGLFEKQISENLNIINSDELIPVKIFGVNNKSALAKYNKKNIPEPINSGTSNRESNEKSDEKNFPELFISDIIPRVMVPRQEGDSEPFYFEKLYLNTKYWSLYLLATGNLEKLEKYLKMLGEFGIGSDKTYGYGKFELVASRITIDIKLPDNFSHYTNLSLFIPEDRNSFDIEQSYYTIIKRGGYITTYPYTTYRKRSVYAFEEGSVIKFNENLNDFVAGKIVDITPGIIINEHTVLRSGKSIFLPVNLN